MAYRASLVGDTRQYEDIQSSLRTSSYVDNLNTTHPFTFANAISTTPQWAHVEFVPEKIVELSVTVDGLRFYKVQWQQSWIAEHQLLPYHHILKDFWSRQNDLIAVMNTKTTTKTEPVSSTQHCIVLPSISNLSSKAPKQNNTTPSSTTNNRCAPAENRTTSNALSAPNTCSSTNSTTNEDLVNNEISGKELSGKELYGKELSRELSDKELSGKDKVDPTLATATDKEDAHNETHQAIVDDENCGRVNGKEPLPPDESCIVEINNVVSSHSGGMKEKGIRVKCDGLDILGVENPNATEDEIREKAREIVGSFQKKKRKFENGQSLSDPDTCFFCLKTSPNGKQARRHMFVIHFKNFGKHECEICHQRFMYPYKLREHVRIHSDKQRVVCEVCNATFAHRSGLLKHLKTHTRESNYRCDVCHKNFKVQADLKTHCITEHKYQITKCNVCKQKLLTGYSVYQHSMLHSGTRDHVCDECGQAFKLKSHLVDHKRNKHLEHEVSECPVCKKKFNSRNSLGRHILDFHQEYATQCRKYICVICSKNYKDKGRLDIHMKLEHANDTQNKDDDMLNTVESIQEKIKSVQQRRRRKMRAINMPDEELSRLSHKIDKVVNPETGDVRLRCKMCRSSFIMISMMLRHLDDHKNGKVLKGMHVCKDCGGKFKTHLLLLQHRKIHTAVKKKTPMPKIVSVEDIHENMEKLTDSNGKVKFRCKLCPNSQFLLVRAMKRHVQEHKDKTPDGSSDTISMKHGEAGQNSDEKDERKQHLSLNVKKREKRSAALNAKSILQFQITEVIPDSDEEETEEPIELGDGSSDYKPCDDEYDRDQCQQNDAITQ